MTARISVIVTTTGHLEGLYRALAGLAAQEVEGLDAIVVNDGGPDVSAVVARAQEVFPARLISLPAPRGRAVARNVGIGVATGRYLAFLDEADFHLPGHLTHLMGLMENTGAEVAYDAGAVTGSPVDLARAAAMAAEADAADDPAILLRGIGAGYATAYAFDGLMLSVADYIPTSAVVCRNLELPGNPGIRFDDRLSVLEDWELWLRLYTRHRCRFVHAPRIGVVQGVSLAPPPATPSHTPAHARGDIGARTPPVGAETDAAALSPPAPGAGGATAGAYAAAYTWVTSRYPAAPGSRVARYRRYLAELLGELARGSAAEEALPPFAHDHAVRALYDGFTGRTAEDAVPVLLTTAVRR